MIEIPKDFPLHPPGHESFLAASSNMFQSIPRTITRQAITINPIPTNMKEKLYRKVLVTLKLERVGQLYIFFSATVKTARKQEIEESRMENETPGDQFLFRLLLRVEKKDIFKFFFSFLVFSLFFCSFYFPSVGGKIYIESILNSFSRPSLRPLL